MSFRRRPLAIRRASVSAESANGMASTCIYHVYAGGLPNYACTARIFGVSGYCRAVYLRTAYVTASRESRPDEVGREVAGSYEGGSLPEEARKSDRHQTQKDSAALFGSATLGQSRWSNGRNFYFAHIRSYATCNRVSMSLNMSR